MNATASNTDTRFLDRPEGRVAYDVRGDGPLVVLVPGMGELRSSYRFLAPELVAAGYRVASTDLRGHGDSDTGFSAYGDEATAGDVVALIAELGGPAVVVGNSLAAGSAVIAAAERPELVAGIALVGPFVRNPSVGRFTAALFRAMTAPAWIAPVWKAYMSVLYAGRKPVDFAEYRRAVHTALRRPSYGKAFSATTRQTDHAPAEAALPRVTAPALVVMGDRDPDFRDPAGEARWIGEALHAPVVLVEDAGHYPQAQQPEATAAAVLPFLADAFPRG
jgi:pimeloyl-ACP methyl ester carboxylesterase